MPAILADFAEWWCSTLSLAASTACLLCIERAYRPIAARQLSSINGKIAAYRARSDVCHGASREKVEAQIRQLIAAKRALLSGLQLDALTVEQLACAHRVLIFSACTTL